MGDGGNNVDHHCRAETFITEVSSQYIGLKGANIGEGNHLHLK